ncbi:THO complex subunit 4A isoform X2 [Cryptomeria japonica]|uniref:THO complex subunit 4A isoform X2 n=1 Tax=Cryptomeria japonica TaxID=3369 RepID=UPI0027DA79D4|nr:THO complex subunit 4A isoform X2 [Cryptomeria japonica]
MSGSLDLSLDDLIKNKKKRSREEDGERGSSGSKRRSTKRSAHRSAPHSVSKSNPRASEHDEAAARPPPAIETGTKLYISNLDYGVTNEDIKELFSEVGDLKRSTIHYDRSGRSKGTAEVVFARKDDAIAAVKRYNNVQLDGKPIKIEFISASLHTPATSTQSMNGLSENTAKSSGSSKKVSWPFLIYMMGV